MQSMVNTINCLIIIFLFSLHVLFIQIIMKQYIQETYSVNYVSIDENRFIKKEKYKSKMYN